MNTQHSVPPALLHRHRGATELDGAHVMGVVRTRRSLEAWRSSESDAAVQVWEHCIGIGIDSDQIKSRRATERYAQHVLALFELLGGGPRRHEPRLSCRCCCSSEAFG